MDKYLIGLEAIDKSFIIHFKGKRTIATAEELPKKICEIIPFLGVQPDDGMVMFYIDICLEKDISQSHPDIEDEMLAAKLRFLQFHMPHESDTMPVLNFNGDNVPKNQRRIEIFDNWAIKVHQDTNLDLYNSSGIPWMVVGACEGSYKMIGNYKHLLIDVTDESIMEWNMAHPNTELKDIK